MPIPYTPSTSYNNQNGSQNSGQFNNQNGNQNYGQYNQYSGYSYKSQARIKKEEKEAKAKAKLKEKMQKPLKTVVHPTRIIAYLVQLAITIVAYDFLRNHFMMLALYIVAAAPVADIILFIFLYKGLEVEFVAPERNVTRFSVGYMNLKVKNSSYAISFDLNAKLDVESPFYGDKNGMIFSLPCRAHEEYEHRIPVRYSMNGIYRYVIESITVRDMLGFVSLKKEMNSSAEVNVFPEKSLRADFDMSDMNRGMTESEETVKKGHDFSDVSDVREYIPGDKLMSIHWKLSAKRDMLMVKDRVSMSDQQMVVMVDLAGTAEQVDEVLTLAYAVTQRLIQDQTYVRLMWWSEGKYEFEERQIMNKDNLREAFASIYYETIYDDPYKTKGYMRSIRPELKAYANVCVINGAAEMVVVEQI